MHAVNYIYFRVDSSSEMGVGHVFRCLALADELSEKGWVCKFLCKDHVGSAKSIIKSKGYSIELLKVDKFFKGKEGYDKWVGSTQAEDAKACLNCLEKGRHKVVVVDHYGLDSIWESIVKPEIEHLVVIDDLVNRAHHCDVLIDSKYGRIEEEYRRLCGDKTIILAGTNYCLLRKDFYELIPKSKEKRNKTDSINRILVAFGGTDPRGHSVKVLEIINEYFQYLNVEVITSSSCTFINEIRKNIRNNINLHIDTNNVASILLQCDFAIGSFGGSSWERCSLGLPSYGLISAANQNEISQALSDSGAVKIIDEGDLYSELEFILSDDFDFKWWKDMSNKSFMLCDGKGVFRVASIIEGLC